MCSTPINTIYNYFFDQKSMVWIFYCKLVIITDRLCEVVLERDLDHLLQIEIHHVCIAKEVYQTPGIRFFYYAAMGMQFFGSGMVSTLPLI